MDLRSQDGNGNLSTSPTLAIERIRKSEDRAQAIVFFLFFSRLEYALKRMGFAGESGEARADWQKYAQEHPDLLGKTKDERLKQAVAHLKESPPKKQIVSNGHLDWADDHFTGIFDLTRVLTLICRIRNNLFHGGKFTCGEELDISRDRKLLDAGLTIMQALLDQDNQLRHLFMEKLE